MRRVAYTVALSLLLAGGPVAAASFSFSTGNPDGRLADAAFPGAQTADDFVTSAPTTITGATFTGLLTSGATPGDINQVGVVVYRLFPLDSDVSRTSGSPVFGTSEAPTRANAPSDTRFDSRASGAGLTFSAATLAHSRPSTASSTASTRLPTT